MTPLIGGDTERAEAVVAGGVEALVDEQGGMGQQHQGENGHQEAAGLAGM